jgi:hypothetical protein
MTEVLLEPFADLKFASFEEMCKFKAECDTVFKYLHMTMSLQQASENLAETVASMVSDYRVLVMMREECELSDDLVYNGYFDAVVLDAMNFFTTVHDTNV